ncbi:MAG: DUF3311 domain-containing protein [Acetobacteraceae bacterium]
MAIEPIGASAPEPAHRAHWGRVLLLLPFVAMIWVSSYDRVEPTLFSVPFFYWYQLLWVLLSTAIIGIVYLLEH